MLPSHSRNLIRVCALSASASLLFAPAAFAGLIESTPALPPANGVYTLASTCISVVCLENIQLFNFDVTSDMISGGNQVTGSNVDLSANVFQNVSGVPGAFISPILLTGQVDITYFSRPDFSESGTFDALLTSLDLNGSLGTHTVTAMLNPSQQSTGVTTVDQLSGTSWEISSFFDVFAELSIDGGPFIPGPGRTASLAPEPAYYLPLAAGLAIILMRRYARAKPLA
jgi:hypothetical protein